MKPIVLMVLAAGLVASSDQGLRPAQRTQAALAAQLRDGSDAARLKAVSELLKAPVQERSVEVKVALRSELRRIKATGEERQKILDKGGYVSPSLDHGLYHRLLLEAVAQENDPATIPYLIDFIETGGLVRAALVRFGALAFSQVQAIAADSRNPREVASALRTLAAMVTGPSEHPISLPNGLLVQVAKARLEGQQHVIVLGAASELALVLRQPDLINRVRTLAHNAEAVQSAGVSDPDLIRWLQEKLVKLLQEAKIPGAPS